MIIHLNKNEAKYLLRVIDLGETFIQTHSWTWNPKWKKLKFDKEKLMETLKAIATQKDDDWKTMWHILKGEYGKSNFEFCEYNLASFMDDIEKENEEVNK